MRRQRLIAILFFATLTPLLVPPSVFCQTEQPTTRERVASKAASFSPVVDELKALLERRQDLAAGLRSMIAQQIGTLKNGN